MKSAAVKACTVLLVLGLSAVFVPRIFSHCQIPCGIYGDEMRFDMIEEHITTIEKSMNQVMDLSQDAANNVNQLVRWVENKEDHANELSEILTYYFMAQRVKPAEESDAEAYKDYTKKLVLLHKMQVAAMKCKQTTDLQHVKDLRDLLDKFWVAYFGPDKERHSHH